MTRTAKMRRGLALQVYLLASYGLVLLARPVLRRRLARGKEHPMRWREKLGTMRARRPDGPLIWLHAVGLGEVLSLRGLIARMHARDPTLSFLVTSTTATSAQVFAKNLPPRTLHQFLPIDAPSFRRRFLDHFRPDLVIWAEQDIWPGFVSDIAARGIPQALVAARMNARSFASHSRAGSVFRDLYRAMAMISAQDHGTANHLLALGAADVSVGGSLKPAAPPLTHNAATLASLQSALAGRFIWAVAPSHPADEKIALDAHAMLRKTDPTALLIIVPRDPERRADIAASTNSAPVLHGQGDVPGPGDSVWICDTFGELGLIYRLAKAVLIGGTFHTVEGHNPWEAATLGCGVLHGPHVANFATDFETLDNAGAAQLVKDADAVVQALSSADHLIHNAAAVIADAGEQADLLARDLITLRKA